MANCHVQLLAFNEALNISKTTRTQLASANRTVREHLKKQCVEKGYSFKRFKVQGSKQFGTLIRKHGEECDIDIGVCFYPKPAITPEALMKAVHRFFVNGHSTQTQPELKKRCVRVPYASRIHIDLPIYYLEKQTGKGMAYLATRQGWMKNDPREFEEWFKIQGGKDKAQLVRLVRYLKAWCHHIGGDRRMPQGVALTVLAGTFFKPDMRDDVALLSILKDLNKLLMKSWSCLMPVYPHDELLRRISKADQTHFMQQLALFLIDAQQAIKARKSDDAYTLWKKHLGRHF